MGPSSAITRMCAQRRALGNTSLRVGVLGIGTVALATPYGAPGGERAAPSPATARRTLERALERGVTLIDTAPAYGNAEAIVGAACRGTECAIATKLAIPPTGWESLSPAEVSTHVRRSAHESLEAIGRERIDLLQIHNATADLVARGAVPAALEELRQTGLVRACGATVYGEENALAAIACPVFDAVQIAYSALDRRPERAVLGAAAESGTTVIVRSVLLRGVLTSAGRGLGGEFAPLGEAADRFRVAIDASWDELAGAAVAFSLTRPRVDCTLLGPRDVDELEALLAGADRFLDSAGELSGDWDSELTASLLDPSRWTGA